jgi:hypothetical protein
VKPPAPGIIEQTITFWEEHTGEKCSQEDARQMVSNVSGFFQVLLEWDKKSRDEKGMNDLQQEKPLYGQPNGYE